MKYDRVEKTLYRNLQRWGKGGSDGQFLFYEQSQNYLKTIN